MSEPIRAIPCAARQRKKATPLVDKRRGFLIQLIGRD
jgi:hypothetical protein